MKQLLASTRNIHAVGRNYVKHARELGNAVPTEPVVFAKSPATLAWGRRVNLPVGLGAIHHELELVLRVGKPVPVGAFQGLDCISHVGLGIDFTAREKQSALKNNKLPWHLAKNFRDGCYITPLSEGVRQAHFQFELSINGETRQAGDSRNMIFDFERVLGFINRTLPLEAGDLIYTGTPEGVGPVAHGDRLRLQCADLAIDETVEVAFDQNAAHGEST